MDLDVFTKSLEKAFNTLKDNVVAYVVGAIIAIVGSIFIITMAPLMYGLTYMAVKGTRGEKVEIGDVFFAFRSLSRFIRSWLYGIILFVIIFVITIICVILGIILAKISPALAVIASLIGAILAFIVMLGLIYSETLYVMTPPSGVIDALKESLTLSKENVLMTIVAVIVMCILGFIGSLFLGLLTFVTTPFSLLYLAYMVKDLRPAIQDTADNA